MVAATEAKVTVIKANIIAVIIISNRTLSGTNRRSTAKENHSVRTITVTAIKEISPRNALKNEISLTLLIKILRQRLNNILKK